MPDDKLTRAHDNDFHPSECSMVKALPEVRGYDFDAAFDFDELIAAYRTTGAQASYLHQAIMILREMRAKQEAGAHTLPWLHQQPGKLGFARHLPLPVQAPRIRDRHCG